MELERKYVQLLKDAVDTELRLLGSHINKSRQDEIRIQEYLYLQGQLEDALLED